MGPRAVCGLAPSLLRVILFDGRVDGGPSSVGMPKLSRDRENPEGELVRTLSPIAARVFM